MTENRLTLAVQKKGRLAEGGLDLLKRAGVKLAYSRDDLLRRSCLCIPRFRERRRSLPRSRSRAPFF